MRHLLMRSVKIIAIQMNCLLKIAVKVKERRDKLHKKKTYKARFIANSSSCTTTERSKLLTPYLTAVKSHVIGTMRQCMKGQEKYVMVHKNLARYLVN